MRIKFFFVIILTFFLTTSCSYFTKPIQKLVLKEFGYDKDKRARLKKEGKKANATIQRVEDTMVTFNNNPKVKIFVRVKPENEEEFDSMIETIVSRVNIPRKDDAVIVYYNPKDKTDIIIE